MKLTSIKANNMANKGLKVAHQQKILKVLNKARKPINYEAIAQRAGLDKHQVHRRLKELVGMGEVHEHDTVSLTSSGRKATNYIKAA